MTNSHKCDDRRRDLLLRGSMYRKLLGLYPMYLPVSIHGKKHPRGKVLMSKVGTHQAGSPNQVWNTVLLLKTGPA